MKKTKMLFAVLFLVIISTIIAGCGDDNATPPAALAVTTASLPGVTVNTTYSQSLAASGGTAPYTWSISAGTLPAGLSLNAATGTITGTPTTVATASFTVKVTDSATPAGTATKALSITVNVAGAPLAITTTTLPAATFGTAYSQTLTASGGTIPYTWAPAPGSTALPTGLTLSAGGVITGTPTAPAVPNATTTNFTVRVTDAVLGFSTMPLAITASLSASASSGKTTYDPNCAGCHNLGIYDTTGGSPNLGITTLAAINARFSGGVSHNGQILTATQITDMFAFVSLY